MARHLGSDSGMIGWHKHWEPVPLTGHWEAGPDTWGLVPLTRTGGAGPDARGLIPLTEHWGGLPRHWRVCPAYQAQGVWPALTRHWGEGVCPAYQAFKLKVLSFLLSSWS